MPGRTNVASPKSDISTKMKNLSLSVTPALKAITQKQVENQNETRPANLGEISIEHGATNIFELRFDERITTAAYDKYNQKYVVVDTTGVIHCITSRSHITCSHPLHRPIGYLLYNHLSRKYIAWSKGEALILIIDETLTEIEEVSNSAPLVAVATSSFREEIVVADTKGILTKMILRFGDNVGRGSNLIPNQTIELTGASREGSPFLGLRVNCLTLDKGGPHFNICLVAYSTSVAEVSWDEKCIVHKKQVHSTEVTALYYNDVRNQIVTGAKDGSIKVWTSDWKLVCILSGHVKNVVQVETCPMTPTLLMSASLDRSVRIWNVDAGLEVSRINIKGGAKGLVVHRFDRQFFVFGERTVSLWKMEQLLILLTVLSSPVETLWIAVHPLLPSRLVAGCSNNSFNVLNMSTGVTLNVNKLEGKTEPHIATAVSVVEDILLALLPGDKGLVRLSFEDNNPVLIDNWSHFPVPVTCLTLYEHIVDMQALRRTMPEFNRSVHYRAQLFKHGETVTSSSGRRKSTNLVLLFTGHADGRLRHIGLDDGTILASVSAHCGKILQLCHIAKMSQMLSLGSDETVRLWQVFPYSDVILMPVKSIALTQAPVRFAMLPHRMCIAFATKRIMMYNLSNPIPLTHCFEDDHTDEICDLTSLESQQLFASASKDKTVRLWTTGNRLIRLLKLDEIPSRIVFSSIKGDLVIAMWKHIFRLPHEKFLPASMLATRPQRLPAVRGPPIETINEDRCYYYVAEEDQMSTVSVEKPIADRSRMERDKVLRYLAERNEDIRRIRDGRLPPPRFAQATENISYDDDFLKLFESVWGKYFIPPSKVELLKPPSSMTLKTYSSKKTAELLMDYSSKKFFPSTVKMCTNNPVYDVHKFRLGFIPNSVLLKILWPEDDSWEAWRTWNYLSIDKVPEEPLENKISTQAHDKASGTETKGFQTCVLIRRGDFKQKDDTRNLDVIFAKMVPIGPRDQPADLSWLGLEEQKALLAEANDNWKILTVMLCRGKHAKRLCEKATKIIYLSGEKSNETKGKQSKHPVMASIKSKETKPKSSLTIQKRKTGHKYCAPQLKKKIVRSKRQRSKSPQLSTSYDFQNPIYVPSTVETDVKSIVSTSSEASSMTSQESRDRKPYYATVPLVSLTIGEVIETMVKCADEMQKHQYSKDYTAKLLRGIGVVDADILVEEIQTWIKEARAQRIMNTFPQFYTKAVTWLKMWMLQYVHHVLVTMEELRRGQVTGRIHYSMVQLILQQNKGVSLTPPLEELSPQDEIYLLSLTCPDSPDQALVETVKPVEVLNYFCEINNETKRQQAMRNLFKKSSKSEKSRSNFVSPGLAVDQSVQDVSTVNKGCAVTHTNIGSWPKGVHLPLKTAEVVLFRKKELPRQDTRLLSYQTCSRHFVHSESYA